MNIPHADFLTPAEFFRGLDLLRPGALPGKHVDPSAVALIYTLHPCEGDEADIRVSPEDRRLIFWPAATGHEKVADREPVLRAMFGPDFREATRIVAHQDGYDSVKLRWVGGAEESLRPVRAGAGRALLDAVESVRGVGVDARQAARAARRAGRWPGDEGEHGAVVGAGVAGGGLEPVIDSMDGRPDHHTQVGRPSRPARTTW